MKFQKVQLPKDAKLPRILILKLIYGDEFTDYIKDDYGVNKFLKKVFEDEKIIFLKNSKDVIEFMINWTIFVYYYKNRLGRSIRDKEAMDILCKEEEFNKINEIYSFRCNIFKADFTVDENFQQKLKDYLKQLKRINTYIQNDKIKYFVNSKVWSTKTLHKKFNEPK